MLRQPAVAGAFYPENPEILKKTIEDCFLGDSGVGEIPKLNTFDGIDYPINIMVPHAGYQYSGAIASHGYCNLVQNGFPEVFIILSPNHTGYGSEVSVFNEGEWITPLGNVKVDDEFANEIISHSDIATADFTAHLYEHSIEVQLPFLQYFSNDFSIVPITMGSQTFSASSDLAKAIFEASEELKKSYAVIASTDLSHFNNQEKANTVDGYVLEDIEDMNEFKLFEEVIQYNITMCGYGPVMTAISLSKMTDKNDCEILAYGTSGDVTGDLSSVVGYASGIFK
ncbi:MAG: AmmeMemoRadiSam system protein B [Methanobrevibacter sp.]|uniref:AmmeMemoRadiSam system protein B n=1 Tax=Methanobrevibacter sp. TaxID=66852 RepID=UPI001D51BF82|nr:AmmeMemoRadiSam system protein B [Methanobrevibacter sp.]MBE6490040.1 AmmeMemoRadiSam system protein B [Methanobrevibacter sp.]MEE0900914.1 AmmeMemoRadiSam system protein B [Methanobrevibacter sp.]MEE0935304.1 AmmeMemoRadiSam system protein B [Methanobrevibacter sp.]